MNSDDFHLKDFVFFHQLFCSKDIDFIKLKDWKIKILSWSCKVLKYLTGNANKRPLHNSKLNNIIHLWFNRKFSFHYSNDLGIGKCYTIISSKTFVKYKISNTNRIIKIKYWNLDCLYCIQTKQIKLNTLNTQVYPVFPQNTREKKLVVPETVNLLNLVLYMITQYQFWWKLSESTGNSKRLHINKILYLIWYICRNDTEALNIMHKSWGPANIKKASVFILYVYYLLGNSSFIKLFEGEKITWTGFSLYMDNFLGISVSSNYQHSHSKVTAEDSSKCDAGLKWLQVCGL